MRYSAGKGKAQKVTSWTAQQLTFRIMSFFNQDLHIPINDSTSQSTNTSNRVQGYRSIAHRDRDEPVTTTPSHARATSRPHNIASCTCLSYTLHTSRHPPSSLQSIYDSIALCNQNLDLLTSHLSLLSSLTSPPRTSLSPRRHQIAGADRGCQD